MDPEENVQLTLSINGKAEAVSIRANETLVSTLRNHFKLTSVRETCGIGVCGSCTVLVNGDPVSACLTLTALSEGKEIITAEGLVSADGKLDKVQEAFIEHHAFQCSFCTPAMVLAVHSLLRTNANPTDTEIKEYLGGNLCRCGSYPNVIEAVLDLASQKS
jgi:aerobic carbon-monoxide dehydrogenase small subunit